MYSKRTIELSDYTFRQSTVAVLHSCTYLLCFEIRKVNRMFWVDYFKKRIFFYFCFKNYNYCAAVVRENVIHKKKSN